MFTIPTARRRRGFTLTEILVAIGIIVILIALLVPMVSRVRRSAQRADVQNQLSSIGAAVERYHADFRAYPGPLSNDQIWQDDTTKVDLYQVVGTATNPLPNQDRITMAENLVLGLLGGLRRVPGGSSAGPGQIVFDHNTVGQGPGNLNPRQPRKYSPYAEPLQLSWTDSQPSSGTDNTPGAMSGIYVDDASLSRATDIMDSPIPEFVDRFSNPMPILYLRARTAAPGIIGDVDGMGTRPLQYDIEQIQGYTGETGAGESIGVGKSIKRGEYKPGPLADNVPLHHGLRRDIDQAASINKSDATYKYPFDAVPYFQDPTIRPTDLASVNATGTPRKKNGFILISAGPDRVYGTYDDITNFGDVAP